MRYKSSVNVKKREANGKQVDQSSESETPLKAHYPISFDMHLPCERPAV